MRNPQLASQSFLGTDSDDVLDSTEIGIVGLGGGGSHVAQQLAHIGIGKFIPVDDDIIEHRNLNRLIGGTADDVLHKRAKVEIAQRLIISINPSAQVTPCRSKWQQAIDTLRHCDVIFGCVDSYSDRDELEKFCRRFLIPYIDLGMDVHAFNGASSVAGQVVLSTPGSPCLWCLGILTKERIAREAARYGQAGPRPQVVWPNGVLASLGVGLLMQLICPWHPHPVRSACLEFDGNRHRVETNRLDNIGDMKCRHHHAEDVGDAFYAISP